MTSNRLILRTALAAIVLAAASVAQAGLVYQTYFGSDDIGGDLTLADKSLAGRNAFTGMLTDSKPIEGFESYANGTTAGQGLSLFGNANKTLTSSTGKITNQNNDGSGFNGRFNTSPGCTEGLNCNWWETAFDFTLDFGGQFSAFAFYGTDFSDFGGSVFIDLLNYDGSGVLNVVSASIQVAGPTQGALLDTTEDVKNGTGNGSLLHFGFTDNTKTYGGVRIRVQQLPGTPPANFDYIGFDDLILGNVEALPTNGAPEPTSLALVGLSLLGLAATRRRLRG